MKRFQKVILFSIPIPLAVGLWMGWKSGVRKAYQRIWPQSGHILRVLSFDKTLPKFLLDDFQRQTHITVLLDTVLDSNQMLRRLRETPGRYDVLIPYSFDLPIPRSQGDILPLDLNKIPAWRNISTDFLIQSQIYHPYSLPILWGAMGFLYQSGKSHPKTFKDLLTKNSRVAIWANPLDVYLHALNLKMLPRGRIRLIRTQTMVMGLAKLLKWVQLESHPSLNDLTSGNASAIEISQGRAAQILQENSDLRFFIPRDGSLFWTCNIALAQHSSRTAQAYLFVNFLLKHARSIVKYSQEAGTITALNSDSSILPMLKPSYLRQLPLSALIKIPARLALHSRELSQWLASAKSQAQ